MIHLRLLHALLRAQEISYVIHYITDKMKLYFLLLENSLISLTLYAINGSCKGALNTQIIGNQNL